MRQIQVAGDALALPFKSGSVGNVTAQNLPGQLLGQGGQKLAGELARTMQSGSTLKITTQTPGALQNFAKLLEETYVDIVIKDGALTAVRR
jgi:enamine deaminase RidA (YjgF/YER057c/UK114 family)